MGSPLNKRLQAAVTAAANMTPSLSATATAATGMSVSTTYTTSSLNSSSPKKRERDGNETITYTEGNDSTLAARAGPTTTITESVSDRTDVVSGDGADDDDDDDIYAALPPSLRAKRLAGE